MNKPSAIFMGSKPGAAVALDVAVRRGWRIPYVVVTRDEYQPWTAGPTLRDIAQRHRLPVVVQKELPRSQKVDFVISYMYRNLVKADVLALARRAAVNFHCAPLPDYGGYGCYNRAILENAREFGATCHYMDESFDTGALLKVRRFPIAAARETALSLERRAQEEMIRLFHDFCALAESGASLPREAQDRSRQRYMTEADLARLKQIPPDADAEMIDRYARAFWFPPYEGAYLLLDGRRIEVMPGQVKTELAALVHRSDFDRLARVAENHDGREDAAA